MPAAPSTGYGPCSFAMGTQRAPGTGSPSISIPGGGLMLSSRTCAGSGKSSHFTTASWLVWAATRLPGIVPDAAHQSIVDETLGKQQPDGGWTIEWLNAH